MTKRTFAYLASCALWVSTAAMAQAGSSAAPAPAGDEWEITVAPYVWAAGINGESGLFGFPPQDIDVSFLDTLKNLDMTFSG